MADKKPIKDLKPWINKTDELYCGGGYYQCPHCEHRFSWGSYFELDRFDFCPKCGEQLLPTLSPVSIMVGVINT